MLTRVLLTIDLHCSVDLPWVTLHLWTVPFNWMGIVTLSTHQDVCRIRTLVCVLWLRSISARWILVPWTMGRFRCELCGLSPTLLKKNWAVLNSRKMLAAEFWSVMGGRASWSHGKSSINKEKKIQWINYSLENGEILWIMYSPHTIWPALLMGPWLCRKSQVLSSLHPTWHEVALWQAILPTFCEQWDLKTHMKS